MTHEKVAIVYCITTTFANIPSDFFQTHISNRSYCNYIICTISLSNSFSLMNNYNSRIGYLCKACNACCDSDDMNLKHLNFVQC